MKHILLTGKLNGALKELNAFLAQYFQVQLCTENANILRGMLKIVKPDLVLISLIGAYDFDASIFFELSQNYEELPVITIGTKEECVTFMKYYEQEQFMNLIRPVENTEILDAICKRLAVDKGSLEKEEVQEEAKSDRKHVLVVDDNAVTLRSIKKMLEGAYDISVAISGMQAMTSIGKKQPDLILLDYEMPVCDGKMTLEMIRADEDLKDIPVIFLTGVNDREHIESVLKLHPAGYFLKPANKEKLIAAIDKALS